MTIAEAKNALGINPEESRQIRNAFYNTLKADHFTSKLEAGDEHWRELKELWIRESELLQRILAPGPADPKHATKLRAMEVLCRDVMKRLRDDQTKRDPSRKRSTSQQVNHVQQAPAPKNNTAENTFSTDISNGISTLASQALASAPMAASEMGDMQIDPSLLQAANDPSFAAGSQHQEAASFGYVDPMLEPAVLHTPVYLRVSPQSQVHAASKTWGEKLGSRTVSELRQLAAARFPDALVSRIEGVDTDENGNDVSFQIDEDHELDAYLSHVHGRKASFLLYLDPIR
jgi:hypothetical protein